MKKYLAVFVVALVALVAVVGMVGPAAARGPKNLDWWSEQPPTHCTITGLVERTDQGLSLFTSGGDEYILTGRDLSSEVGEEVAVTGRLSKNLDEKPEIAVRSFTIM